MVIAKVNAGLEGDFEVVLWTLFGALVTPHMLLLRTDLVRDVAFDDTGLSRNVARLSPHRLTMSPHHGLRRA